MKLRSFVILALSLCPVFAQTVTQFNGAVGSGSGASSTTQLTDFRVLRTNSTILTSGGSCAVATPCNFRLGSTVTSLTTSPTATISAGTGTAYFYIDSAGVFTVGHNLTLTCAAGCTAVGAVTAFPAGSIPLWTWTATAGTWDTSGGLDKRAFISIRNAVAAAGATVTDNGVTLTIGADFSVVTNFVADVAANKPANCTGNGQVFLTTDTHLFSYCVGVTWYSPAGTGTVTSIATSCGVSGGTITTTGTISGSLVIDSQAGAGAYAIPNSDCGKLIYRNSGGGVPDTIAQAGAGGNFPANWYVLYNCADAGANGGCVITPATSTIDGAASVTLWGGESRIIQSDGTNYRTYGTKTIHQTVTQTSGQNNFFIAALNGVVTAQAIISSDLPANIAANTSGTAANLSGTPALPNGTTATTQSQLAGDTKLATDSYVDTAVANAVSGVNPAVAVQAASAAVLPNSPVYNNGAAGIGATLTTATTNTALVVDGYTMTLNDRVLVKNQASTFQNGVYFLSTLQGVAIAWVLTRALDYDQPSDMNNTGAIPVINGTVNASTQWVQSSKVATVGTDAVTFAQFSLNPSTVATCTGDLSGSAPGCTVSKINGVLLSGLATGIAKLTAGVPSIGVSGTDYAPPSPGASGVIPTSDGAGGWLSSGCTAASGFFGCGSTVPNGTLSKLQNDSGTGTTAKLLAKIDSSGHAVLATTSDTTIPVYIVQATTASMGCTAGTSGNACLSTTGSNTCTMDAAGSTIQHYIGASTATNGRCMDLGATRPTTNTFVVGQALATVGANADVTVLVIPAFGGPAISSVTTPLKGDGLGNGIAMTASDQSTLSYVTGGGTAQAQTATLAVAPTLTDGLRVCWKPSNANTATAPTFSPNSLTAHTIVKANGAGLIANDIITTAIACAIYDTTGTQWELQNPQTAPGIPMVSNPGQTVTNSSAFAWYSGTLANSSEPARTSIIAKAGYIDNMYVYTQGAQSATGTMVITLRKCSPTGGPPATCTMANCNLTITVPTSDTGGQQPPDTTHSCTVAAGDIVSFSLVQGAGTSSTVASISTVFHATQ